MPGMNLNSVTLSGGLTFDPELKSLPSGTMVCELRMAFTESRKNNASGEWEDHSGYIDATLWGGMATWAAKEMRKGSQIVLVGELRYESWTDKETGKERSKIKLNAHSAFRDRGGSGQRSEESYGSPPATGFQGRSDVPSDVPAAQQQQAAPAATPPPDDSDIPFLNDGFPTHEERRERGSRW